MGSITQFEKREVSPVIVYPLKLVFSPKKSRETITLVNENNFELQFSLSTSRAGSKALFVADITSGSIEANSEELVTIEFKGNEKSPNVPIILHFNDPLSEWSHQKEILWYFVTNIDESQNEENEASMLKDFDQYTPSALPKPISEDSKKLLGPLSATIFLLSLINFSYIFYFVFFGQVDHSWTSLINKYELKDISLRCSSWFEAHMFIHNLTCKLH